MRLKGQPGQVRCCNRDGALYRAICEGGVRRSWSCAIILSPHNHAAGCRRRSCTRLSFGSGAIRLYTRETTPVYTVCRPVHTWSSVAQCSCLLRSSLSLVLSPRSCNRLACQKKYRSVHTAALHATNTALWCWLRWPQLWPRWQWCACSLSLRSALDATSKDSERESERDNESIERQQVNE